jgi:hypothetical protein
MQSQEIALCPEWHLIYSKSHFLWENLSIVVTYMDDVQLWNTSQLKFILFYLINHIDQDLNSKTFNFDTC